MKTRLYVVYLEDQDDPILVRVKDDINRPNNLNCDEILEQYMHDNYGYVEWDCTELDEDKIIDL